MKLYRTGISFIIFLFGIERRYTETVFVIYIHLLVTKHRRVGMSFLKSDALLKVIPFPSLPLNYLNVDMNTLVLLIIVLFHIIYFVFQ